MSAVVHHVSTTRELYLFSQIVLHCRDCADALFLNHARALGSPKTTGSDKRRRVVMFVDN